MKIAIKSGLLPIRPFRSKKRGLDAGIIVSKNSPNPLSLKKVENVFPWKVINSDKTIEEELGNDNILLSIPGNFIFEQIPEEPYVGKLINYDTGQSIEDFLGPEYLE